VADEFREIDDGALDLIVDGGPCPVGLESTIVKADNSRLTLLRPGAVTIEELETISGIKVTLPASDGGIEAPGMMVSHYAPDAMVLLDCETCEKGDAWLGFGNREQPREAVVGLNLSPSSNLVEAAANLYDYLKRLDASAAKNICVSPIPEEGLGIAINDRLKRASAPRQKPEKGN
jgi:L-threonylcarbamoyladenylate synthase